MSYFPNLTAEQIKYAIEKSAKVPTDSVSKPGSDDMVSLSEISKTGGVINALEAAKIAATLKPEGKKSKRSPRSAMKNDNL